MREYGSLALPPFQGHRLFLDDYHHDFEQRDAAIHDHPSWKFERGQHFEEQDDASREALRRHDWDGAMRLLDEERDEWRQIARDDEERGSVFHRVRVVEEPLSPYMVWELQALRVQAECGMSIRVVRAESLNSLERTGPLPEVVILGGQVLYEVIYTESGVLSGARRFTDPRFIEPWEAFIKELYEHGNDVVSYAQPLLT
jgi:hypothetical protein